MIVPQGKMGEVHLRGRNGGMVKARPVVVIEEPKDYLPGSTIEVVVITHSPDEPDGEYVPVPWQAQGRCSTRLCEESWAAVHWVERVCIEELNVNAFGSMKIRSLKTILEAIGKRENL